jgi:hypothetical protein
MGPPPLLPSRQGPYGYYPYLNRCIHHHRRSTSRGSSSTLRGREVGQEGCIKVIEGSSTDPIPTEAEW